MKKVVYVALLLNFLISPFQILKAEDFADPNDIFNVITPVPNSKVGGNINIEWTSFDNNQTSIPYYIELLDGTSCKTSSYGRINSNSASLSSSSSTNKISWDTHKTLSNQNLADGTYCLQICSAFKKDDQYYSICNGRNITIVNVNKLPTISSTPSVLTINETEAWQYQVNSSDPDNDSLKYYLSYAPDFLEINTTSGLIKTKSGASRISSDLNIAEYRVVVGVDDGVSGSTTQEFTIRVEKGRTANPTNGGNSNSNGGTTTPEAPQNTPTQITFANPKENSELTGVQNFVEWSVYDADGVKEITLSYSADLENWTEIINKADTTFSRYSWDVSNITDGKYYLQLKVKDKKDEVVAKVSKVFSIKNNDNNPISQKPLIVNIKPENSKSLSTAPNSITGDFAPIEGQTIDTASFKLKLNDKDITNDCVVNVTGFSCSVKDILVNGDYRISTEIADTNGNKGTFESTFTIFTETVSSAVKSQTGNSNNNIIIIAIAVIILVIVLVGLPWFFIGFTKRKSKSNSTQTLLTPETLQPAPVYAYPQATVTVPESKTMSQNQGTEFSDFMSNYSFNNQPTQAMPSGQQPTVAKTVNTPTPKTSLSDTFKGLKNKVSSFVPKKQTSKVEESTPVITQNNPNLSQNIQTAYTGSTTTKPAENYAEPQIVDELSAVNAVQPPKQTEEELKRMYPELYGTGIITPQTPEAPSTAVSTPEVAKPVETAPIANPAPTTDTAYFEPTPKD